MAITTWTDAEYSALFKTIYGKLVDNLYATGKFDPLLSQVTKLFDNKGKEIKFPVRLGFGGGTGFGSIPDARESKYAEVVLNRKRAYATLKLDRETIKASKGEEAAFIEATKEETLAKVRNYNRVQALCLYNDGTMALGQFSGNSAGTAADPVLTIIATSASAYGFRPFFFEEGDDVQINVDSSRFVVTAVNPVAGTVTLNRVSGSLDLTAIGAGTHTVYLYGSKDLAPQGLLGVVEWNGSSPSTMYGVAGTRRWKSPYMVDEDGKALSFDIINGAMLTIGVFSGENPDLIIVPPEQMKVLMGVMEDRKVSVTLESKKNSMSDAVIGIPGIKYVGPFGEATIVVSRYVRKDRVYYVNTNKIEQHHCEQPKWFDEDGTVLHHMLWNNTDAYQATYGCYYENFINPQFHGGSKNLAII